MVLVSAVVFSAKAIIAKLAYRHGVEPIALLTLRMAFALPFFATAAVMSGRRAEPPLTRADAGKIVLLGVLGYYLASVFDFEGLRYISASLERLILYVYPTLVVLISAVVLRVKEPALARPFRMPVGTAGMVLAAAVPTGVGLVFVGANGAETLAWGALAAASGPLAYLLLRRAR